MRNSGNVGLFIDWENIMYSIENQYRDKAPLPSAREVVNTIITKARDYGRLTAKVARYGIENGFGERGDELLAAFERVMIEAQPIRQKANSDEPVRKNIADLYLAVDILKHLYQEDLDTFIVATGDGDFFPIYKEIADRQKKPIIFALERSLSEFIKEAVTSQEIGEVFLLDDLLFAKQRQISTLASEEVEEGAELSKYDADIKSLTVTMIEQLWNQKFNEISEGRFGSSMGLTDAEWLKWEKLIDITCNHGRAYRTSRRMPDGNMISHYSLSWSNEYVAETAFRMTQLIRAIHNQGKGKPDNEVALSTVLDILAPLPSDEDQPDVAEERRLLRGLYSIALDRGAIKMTQKPSRVDETHLATLCSVCEEHPLVNYALRPATIVATMMNWVKLKNKFAGNWVKISLFHTYLDKVESRERLDGFLEGLQEEGIIIAESHNGNEGYTLDREHPEVSLVLGNFRSRDWKKEVGEINEEEEQKLLELASAILDAPDGIKMRTKESISAAYYLNLARVETAVNGRS